MAETSSIIVARIESNIGPNTEPRIESGVGSASAYGEPQGEAPPLARKEKPRLKAKAVGASRERSEADELDDSEKHQLDTLA
jgi:hypothetical protein